MSTLRTIVFALVPLAIVLALLEVVFRSTHLFGTYVSWTTHDSNLGFRYVPGNHYWFFREGNLTSKVHVNRYGWIAPEWPLIKPEGHLRIAVLGDSFLEALQVDRAETAAAVAERELRQRFGPGVEVMTFGRSGFSQTEQLFVLQTEVMRFAPDVIVNFFFPGNDIADVSRSTTEDTLRPFYTITANGNLLFDNSFNKSGGYRFRVLLDPFKRRSVLLSVMFQAYNKLRRRRSEVSLQSDAKKGYLSLCTSEPDSNFQASYKLNRRLLETEIAVAQRQQVPLVLVTLDTPAYKPQVAEQLRHKAPTFDPYCFQSDTERLARSLGAYHLGLQSVFSEAYAKEGIELHWPTDGHWNAAGNRLVGHTLAETIVTVLGDQVPRFSHRMASGSRH